jgi:isoleucyl-tRNA synthetase
MDMPVADASLIDKDLEEKMHLAQKISSMVLSLRKRTKIKVRQPLAKIMIPVLGPHFKEQVLAMEKLILSEVNVKEIEFMTEDSPMLVKKLKPNFKALGPRYGKLMKKLAAVLVNFDNDQIRELEQNGKYKLELEGEMIEILLSDCEIITQDIEGWLISSEGSLTVALDVILTDELRNEGIARELVNRIQSIRKELDFEVVDNINLFIEDVPEIKVAVSKFLDYICSETLTQNLEFVDQLNSEKSVEVELSDNLKTNIKIEKVI